MYKARKHSKQKKNHKKFTVNHGNFFRHEYFIEYVFEIWDLNLGKIKFVENF